MKDIPRRKPPPLYPGGGPRVWNWIDPRALAQIPQFCYTAIIMQRIMPFPQLPPPREEPFNVANWLA